MKSVVDLIFPGCFQSYFLALVCAFVNSQHFTANLMLILLVFWFQHYLKRMRELEARVSVRSG